MTTDGQTPDERAQVDALFAQGVRLEGAGRWAEAAAAYRQILEIKPDFAEAHHNLGNAAKALGQLDEAVALYRQSLALKPNLFQAHFNLGCLLETQQEFDAALAHFEQLLALAPQLPEAHFTVAGVLRTQGRFDEAVAHYRSALALRPAYAEAHNNLGNILLNQGRVDEAATHFEQALACRPNYALAHNNLAVVLRGRGELDQAAAHLEQAVTLEPRYAEALNNLGAVRYDLGRPDEAAAHYRQALTLQPEMAEAEVGLAACYLAAADDQRGWPAYEARLRLSGAKPLPALPRWNGEDLAGRKLLLTTEQGIGDTIQFVRYAAMFKQMGAHVMLTCQPALVPLLSAQADWDEVFPQELRIDVPRPDFFLPLLSCPAALGTTFSTLPGKVPYLFANPRLIEKWRESLAEIEGFKIGIVWQGSREFASDRWRSIPLKSFEPLARVPGVQLVSLQKGFGSEQVGQVDFPILNLADRLDERTGAFMDTAAVIKNLDLVVAPDTSVVHLAGALGVPVFLALHRSANWRWLRDRDDSPWYPSMRLFRQLLLGDWMDVFQRIAAAVAASCPT